MDPDDVKGATVYDSRGERVGTVEEIYPNDGGAAQYARVKIGRVLGTSRLVPMDGANKTNDGVQVPYTKDAIERSIEVPKDVDPLSGIVAEDLGGYYATAEAQPAAEEPAQPEPASTPIQETSPRTEVEGSEAEDRDGERGRVVEQTQDMDTVGQVRDHGDVVDIPIVEERLVKKPVVTEVIRVRKTQSSDEHVAAADVRREDVEVEQEGDVPVRDAPEES